MKKQFIITIAFILGLIIGFSVLLYPTVAEYFNSISQSRAVAYYSDDIAKMDNSELQAALDAAYEYNEKLLHTPDRFEFTEEDTAEYKKLLNTGRGIMGILVIDKINVRLSIYHGTDQGILQIGLGHMQGTSLPVGGTGTHSFITGHRGVPSATLLTELSQMKEGDTFMIYVMGNTLTYEVDDIQVVEPEQVNALDIDPDMDYCTLVTCTPYGVNTHRLLVRGVRIENNDSAPVMIFPGAKFIDKLLIIIFSGIPVIFILLIIIVIGCVIIYKRRKLII